MAGVGLLLEASLPYLVMTLYELLLALFLVLQQSVLADGVNAIVVIVHQQLISALLLALLALFFDRGKIPPLPLDVLSLAFLIGLLQIPIEQLLMVTSLRYITSTLESVGMNTIPVVVFVLSVLTGRERFGFRSFNGQAKLLGISSSMAGAFVLVIFDDSRGSDVKNVSGPNETLIGCLLVGLAVLAASAAYLILEKLTLKFRKDLTLSAITNVFGAVQLVVLAAITERNYSSWKIKWSNSLHLITILYGGIITTGIMYFGRTWCIHKKGPVFVSVFSPLLIVFSFLIQTLIFRASAQLWSIVAALLVTGGLYLLLWAKSRDCETSKVNSIVDDDQKRSFENSTTEPLQGNV